MRFVFLRYLRCFLFLIHESRDYSSWCLLRDIFFVLYVAFGVGRSLLLASILKPPSKGIWSLL
jgi:hypothetical protein